MDTDLVEIKIKINHVYEEKTFMELLKNQFFE